MPVNINFGGVEQPNFLDIAAKAYDTGRGQARDRGLQDAYGQAATNPLAASAALMRYGDVQGSNALRDRAYGQQTATAMAAGNQSAATSAAANQGPEQLEAVTKYFASMDDRKRELAAQSLQQRAALLQGLAAVPDLNERLRQGRHLAQQHGIDPNTITPEDVTDNGLRANLRSVMTAAQAIEAAKADATAAETHRHNVAEETKPVIVAPGSTVWQPNAPPGGEASAGNVTSPAPQAGQLDATQFFRDFVAPHEGGLNPHDANGSPTNFGINQAANPGVDVHNLTPDSAARIFADKYFAASGAEHLPPALAAVHADTYFINPARATQFLAQSGGDPQKYMDLRDAWMQRLVKTDPTKYGPYQHAWTTRNADLRQYAQQAGNFGTPASVPAPPGGQATGGRAVYTAPPKPEDEGIDLTGDALDQAAERYVANGTMPPLGMGKPAASRRDAILNRAADIERTTGRTGEQAVAAWAERKANEANLRDATKTRATVQASEQTVLRNIDVALSLAPKGLANSVPVFNRWIQHGRAAWAGDADVTALNTALVTVANEYAKVMTTATGVGGATSDSARNEAQSLLNSSQTPQQLQANLAVLKREMANRMASLRQREDEARSSLAPASDHSATPHPTTPPTPMRDGYPVFTAEQARASAQIRGNKGRGYWGADGVFRRF